ncbi:hypothetical protein CAPTEDRAFT_177644 [Capitella teleta]|uniref:RING-type domain-containing protein n=1 Tax=Capitella teleta TaxID=283909 RepID=R7TX30_CAPTE|nr:hypothetical protein CAPTEDRAFT_177644 [Capitella teleta]|eukprot:ELT98473.1 hypothetical protein CAPTEDRAFT_177644 [Capitella teleta]
MATEGPIERVGDELLTCSICYDHYEQPKVLPCLHTYCQKCIARHYEVHRLRQSGQLSCPSCRELIKPPPGGIAAFRNDGAVKRTEELLKTLPGLDGEVEACEGGEYARENAMLEGARGMDRSLVASQRQAITQQLARLQDALRKLRSKLLQLYAIETYVKYSIEMEIDSKAEAAKKTGHEPKQKWLEAVRVEMQALHAPTMAELASEQDKLYQKIVEIVSVASVAEAVLTKASIQQFDDCFDTLSEHISAVEPLAVQFLEEGSAKREAINQLVPKYKLSSRMASEVGLMLGSGNEAKRRKLAAYSGDLVQVRLLAKVSGRGTKLGKFDYPTNATFVHDGSIVVCDKNNKRLQILDAKGTPQRLLLEGCMKPRRARVCPVDGLLYVSDELASCVRVFTLDGKHVRSIGDTEFQCPAGMAFNSKGHLVLTDSEKCYVYVYKRNGSLITRFFFKFIKDRNMSNPYFVAVNEDDQIIISDCRNGLVKVFSITGNHLFTIADLVIPRGVCVDPYGNILVAEGDKHRISMYNPYGKFMQYIIDQGQFGLKFPMSLDVNEDGQLVVTQCGFYDDHEVLLFQLY